MKDDLQTLLQGIKAEAGGEYAERYAEIGKRIGNTPIFTYSGPVPNDCRILIKDETRNLGGSHYGRVMYALIGDAVATGRLQPGTPLLETTSGEAGIALATIGKELGHPVRIIIPDGSTTARRRERLQELGAELILTPAEQYLGGFTREVIQEEARDAYFLNHSMGRFDKKRGVYRNNEVTLRSLEAIAEEVTSSYAPDIFVAGLGNGSSLVGPGRRFRQELPEIRIVGFLPYETGSSEATGLLNQEGLKRQIPFPHLCEAYGFMAEAYLLGSQTIDERIGFRLALPRWDDPSIVGLERFGVTTRGGVAVALEEVRKAQPGSTILVLGYNLAEHDTPLAGKVR